MAKKKAVKEEQKEETPNNAIVSLKVYKELLEKHKIEENKLYNSNFILELFPLGEEKISKIKFGIVITSFALSPFISIYCYKEEDILVGNFGIMDKKVILDNFDRAAIKDELKENLKIMEDYDSKLIKKILDKMKVKV